MTAVDPSMLDLGGTHLIEASAGTGKTYTIATLYTRLLVERGLSPERIVVVTFTEAAAAELKDRVRARLREVEAGYADPGTVADPSLRAWIGRRAPHADDDLATLRRARHAFDEASILTIHGFCQRVLIEYAFESGGRFESELLPDETPVLEAIVADYWAQNVYRAPPPLVAYLYESKVGPSSLLPIARAAARHPDAPVIPAPATEPPVTWSPDQIEGYHEAFREARRRWHEDREEVTTLLTEHPGLYANTYPKADLGDWFHALDAYFAPPTPATMSGFKHLARLTPTVLRQRTKKAYADRVPEHPFFDACEALISARDPLLAAFDAHRLQLRRGLAVYARRELPRRKQARGLQSFDDMLQDLWRALEQRATGPALAAAIRNRYQAALIDEFQDTDGVQSRIFSAIYGPTELPLFLIGDPKQAIYAFRGADVYSYLDVARGVKRLHRHTMKTNWRSDRPLVAAIGRLFDVPNPFRLEDIAFVDVEARPDAVPALWRHGQPISGLEVLFVRRTPERTGGSKTIATAWVDAELPRGIAADIASLLAADVRLGPDAADARPLHAGDVAVLVRTNAQAQRMQVELRALGIPSVVYGDASVFHGPRAEELHHVLSAIADPSDPRKLRAALATPLLGMTAPELDALDEDEDGWAEWAAVFRRFHGIWLRRGFVQMFRDVLSHLELAPRLLQRVDGERCMTDLLHLAELLHDAAVRQHLTPSALLRWFAQARHAGPTTLLEHAKLRLESDERAVQLVTTHRSKGLEYPIVYCAYAWRHEQLRRDDDVLVFHDPDDGHTLKIDVGLRTGDRGSASRRQAQVEREAEGMRLLYVALTRARHRCVVVWGGFYEAMRSGLGHLIHPESRSDVSDDDMVAQLELRGAGAFGWRDFDAISAPPKAALDPVARTLEARSVRRRFDRTPRVSSFTAMTQYHGGGEAVLSARDRDDVVTSPRTDVRPEEERSIRLADFPRGTAAGNVFHDILEQLDFAADPHTQIELTARALRTYGISEASWVDPVRLGLDEILHTPLTPLALRLADIPRHRRRSEFGFTLCATPDRSPVRADTLGAVYREHAAQVPPGYARRMRDLDFPQFRGFVRGFIDLVFEHDGKFFLADFKTHHLGDTLADYAEPSLAEVMLTDHYVLQGHLYAVALLRHLARRRPGFDVERDFGGVFFLFLRGMVGPTTPPGHGVYFERPDPDLLRALDRALGTRSEEASA